MKTFCRFILYLVAGICCVSPLSVHPKVLAPTLLLSNTATGLSLEQQATRIQVFRILNPVIRNGMLEISDDTACTISDLDMEPYFEYARQYCQLYNALQKNLGSIMENDIPAEVTPVGVQVLMDYVDRDSSGFFVLGISKEDALKTGILPEQYERVESEIRANNRSVAKWIEKGSLRERKNLKSTMISALGVRVEPVYSQDPALLRIYDDFEKAFVRLNQKFK